MNKFVDLHVHSTFSFLDSWGTPEQIVDKACSLGREAIALTDHGSVSGLCMLEKACIKNNIKSILGCEFYCSDTEKTRERYHLTVLAKSLVGYRNLTKLVGSAWENFYYFPILKTPDLVKYSKDLIIFSGCLESKLSKLILADDAEEADKLVKKFKSKFEDFYIEIQPFDLEESIKVNKVAFKLAKNNKVDMVLTNDVHYPDVKYQDVRRILRAIRFRKKYAEIDADTQNMSILTYKEIYDKMFNIYGDDKVWKSSMENTVKISDLCEEYTIPKAKMFRFDIPNKKEHFRELCYNGLKNRGFQDNKEYIDRLEYELNIIEEKNYLDYFIVVHDLVNWAKDNNIFVGPARGCFLPKNNLVRIRTGFNILVEKVKVGIKVLTHDATYQRVIGNLSYFIDEECVRLKLSNGKTIECTKDHLIMTKNGWKESQFITNNDILLCPITSKRRLIDFNCIDCSKTKKTRTDRILKGENLRCVKCANKFMANTPEGLKQRRAGALKNKSPESRAKNSKTISRLMQEGLREKISKGVRKALENDSTITIRAQKNMRKKLRENPDIIDKMQRSYNWGHYYSKKCNRKIFYQSSYELKALNILETNNNVVDFDRCHFVIDYELEGKSRLYKPDFWYQNTNNKKTLLEVKANWFLTDKKIEKFRIKKFACAEDFVYRNGWKAFEIWTEKDLFDKNDLLHTEVSVIGKEFFPYKGNVYDLRVENSENYTINGVSVHNSSGGSLLCYVLNITEVDPIKFELLFERFLDITRTDYPDIDIDFTDEDRIRIFEYLIGKYGKNKVAHIGTFAKFKGRNSLDEVGKAFDVPPEKVDIIKRLLIDRSIADSRASFTIQDTINKFSQAKNISIEYPDIKNANLLEGQYRHMGIHAAGMIISKEPLEESMALYTRKDTVIASLDKDDIEYLGFLKFDLLGLKTLNLLKKICGRVGLTYKDLIKISMEDEKTLDGFKRSDIVGIFQYEGRTASSLIGHIKPDCFDLIRDVNALIRPGPLYSRDTSNYILVRNNPKMLDNQFENEVDVIKDITRETYGQILYQEQVMQVVRNIASFSWMDTAKIRHAMSKSLGDEFMSDFKEKFINGAMENGYDEDYVEKLWSRVNSHGSWSFCKSHAVGYAILAFWTMYMKQHYPLEFYWASLSLEEKDFNKARLMLDLTNKGYKILPPRINFSKESWEIENGSIRSGLLEIKGIGDKVAQHIVNHYPYKDLEDMKAKLSKRLFNSKIVSIVQNGTLFDKKSSNKEFTVFKDLDILSSVETTHRIKQIDYFADEKTRIKDDIVIACFIKEKMMYNIYEEDKIRERTIRYKDPEVADYMVITMSDFTDIIKGRLSRYIYKDYKDLLWDLKETDPVRITCKSRGTSRVVDILKIEKIKC